MLVIQSSLRRSFRSSFGRTSTQIIFRRGINSVVVPDKRHRHQHFYCYSTPSIANSTTRSKSNFSESISIGLRTCGYLARSVPSLSWLLLKGALGIASPKQVQTQLIHHADHVLRPSFRVNLEVEDRNRGEYNRKPTDPGYVFVLLNQTSLAEQFTVLPALHHSLNQSASATTSNNSTPAADASTTSHPYWFIFANFEFLLMPLYGWLMSLFSIMVIRQSPKQARSALDRAINMVQAGHSCYISIEGKRRMNNNSNEPATAAAAALLSPYKKGPAILAIQANNATIVPVFVKGADTVWPSGDWRIQPDKTVKVVFLEKVHTKGLELQDRDELVRRLRNLAETEIARDRAITTTSSK